MHPRGQELAPAEEEEEKEEDESGRSWRPAGAPAQGRWDWTLGQPDQSLPFHAQMQLRRQPGAWWRADGGVAAIARLVLCERLQEVGCLTAATPSPSDIAY